MTAEEQPAVPVVCPGPDPERDARVAKRRAADAARAGRALDELLDVRAPAWVDPPGCWHRAVGFCDRVECQVGDGE